MIGIAAPPFVALVIRRTLRPSSSTARLGAASCIASRGRVLSRRSRRCSRYPSIDPRPGKVGACQGRDPLAQLLPQRAGPDLGDLALRQLAELERAEGDPDEPAHGKTE